MLLVGFAIMDGHDMGMGVLLPFVGSNDLERRVVINTVGPALGRQPGLVHHRRRRHLRRLAAGLRHRLLRLLLGDDGGAVGAVLPPGRLRLPLQDHSIRRGAATWDWGLFIGGAVPPLIFGVAFGNLLLGVPFHFDDYLMSTYTGSFWALLNPFALLAGVVSLGDDHLPRRELPDDAHRGRHLPPRAHRQPDLRPCSPSRRSPWRAYGWPAASTGYVITSVVDPGALPDPLAKTVEVQTGAWMHNYTQYAWAMWVPIAAFAALAASILFSRLHQAGAAFWSSSLACAGIIGTAGVSMFPFVMPSSLDPRSSLTAYDAVSSHLTLGLMLGATVIFMPLIVFYTSWAYKVMWGKVTTEYIAANDKSVY